MTSTSSRRVRSALVGVAIATGLSGLALAPAHAAAAPAAPAAPAQQARWRTAELPSGWSLASSGPRERLAWRAPVRGMGDAQVRFYSGERLLGTPRPGPDGTYRLDLPAGSAGDPARLEARAGGRRVDAAGLKAASQPVEKATPTEPATLPPSRIDPGRPGRYRTVTGEYGLAALKLPDFPRGVEMRAVVVAPKGARGKRPLALFLHGRHSVCYGGSGDEAWPCPKGTRPIPSYRGYLRAQNLLASQGYVTVSISANGINGQDYASADGGAQARSSLIRQHLADWAGWAGTRRSKAPAIVRAAPVPDLTKVLLMGHSRGGEGVNRAAIDSLNPPPSAADGYHGKVLWKIRGTLQLAPTNFGHDPAADVPSVVVLPGCDGDVYDQQGQITVDGTRGVGSGTALHSAAFVVGANHNYFNSEWTPGLSKAPSWDDWFDPSDKVCGGGRTTRRLSPTAQQQVGATYIAAAARLFVAGDRAVQPLLDGSGVRAASAGQARVLSHAVGANRQALVVPAADTTVTGSGATKVRLCKEVSSTSTACGRGGRNQVVPSFVPLQQVQDDPDRYAADLSWTAAGGSGASLKPKAPVSLSGATSVAARVIVPPNSVTRQYDVTIADAKGRRATLGRFSLAGLPGTANTVSTWAQEVRVPLAKARTLGVDLRHVAELRVIPRSTRGQAYLLDAWGWRAGAPAIRIAATVRVDVGTLQPVLETDSAVTYRMPVAVSGKGSGQLRVFTADYNGLAQTTDLITVKAGDTFTVPLTVRGDDAYSYGDQYLVLARAVRGTVVGDYVGDLQVDEDDPPPTVSVTPLAGPVVEGGTLKWQLDLSAPVATDLWIPVFLVAPAAGSELSTTDVTKAWVEQELFADQLPSRPLSTTQGYLAPYVPPGTTRVEVTVPTVKDEVAETDEYVDFEVASLGPDPLPNPPHLLGTVTNGP